MTESHPPSSSQVGAERAEARRWLERARAAVGRLAEESQDTVAAVRIALEALRRVAAAGEESPEEAANRRREALTLVEQLSMEYVALAAESLKLAAEEGSADFRKAHAALLELQRLHFGKVLAAHLDEVKSP